MASRSRASDPKESSNEFLKVTAKARYDILSVDREPFLDRARDCSALTIPYLIPEDGLEGQKLPSLFQSVGANGVTNLASKLLMTMLPPNEPCFRLRINNMVLTQELEETDKEVQTKINSALSKMEQAILNDIESTTDRPVVHEGNMHLIVGGNVLYHNDPETGLRMFPLSSYVVKRDSAGTPIEIVVREEISMNSLPMDFIESLRAIEGQTGDLASKIVEGTTTNPEEGEKEVELYTHLQRTPKKWTIYQECMGKIIPGTQGSYKIEECPWFPVRMYSIAGENYGRSFVEQQIGDLTSLETLNQALVEGAAVSSKLLFFVNPNSVTDSKAVAEAENGAVLEGTAEDISTLQVAKGNDFQVTASKIQDLERNLKTSFLMMDGIRRDAERVTAEEIRIIAQELEAGLGGVYTTVAKEFQLPYIRSRIAAMQKQKRIPELPKGLVSPAIVTGFDAIGRGTDKTKLIEFLTVSQQTFGEMMMQYVNPLDAIARLASAIGISTEGLIKTPEEIQAETSQAEQQAMSSQMMDKLGPEVVKQGGEMMRDNPEMMMTMSQNMGGIPNGA